LKLWEILAALLIVFLASVAVVEAIPSQSYYVEELNVTDDWGVKRSVALKPRGFIEYADRKCQPLIVFECMGAYSDVAWRLGKRFAEKYPDPYKRAEAIFEYVKKRVSYLSDSENFGLEEYAQNPDELALLIQRFGEAWGDCEDYAALLAVMFKAAGLRSAIILVPGHAAALVYLPGYKNANYVWSVNGEEGWIWAEATGKNNKLGWTPAEFIGAKAIILEIPDKPPAIAFKQRAVKLQWSVKPSTVKVGQKFTVEVKIKALKDLRKLEAEVVEGKWLELLEGGKISETSLIQGAAATLEFKAKLRGADAVHMPLIVKVSYEAEGGSGYIYGVYWVTTPHVESSYQGGFFISPGGLFFALLLARYLTRIFAAPRRRRR